MFDIMCVIEDYKSLGNYPAVYRITNTLSGKKYIGSSIDVKRRLFHHLYHSRKPLSRYDMLQENMMFEVIEECHHRLIRDMETLHILKENTLFPNGYNVMHPLSSNMICDREHYDAFKRSLSQETIDEYHRKRAEWYSENRLSLVKGTNYLFEKVKHKTRLI